MHVQWNNQDKHFQTEIPPVWSSDAYVCKNLNDKVKTHLQTFHTNLKVKCVISAQQLMAKITLASQTLPRLPLFTKQVLLPKILTSSEVDMLERPTKQKHSSVYGSGS